MPPKSRGGGKKSASGSSENSSSIPLASSGQILGRDPCHNEQQPCSHVLTSVARQIFPPASSTTSASAACTLPNLLHEHLVQQMRLRQAARRKQHEQQQHTNTSGGGAAKKKKKKKKKKKAATPSANNELPAESAAAVTERTTEEHHHHHQQLPTPPPSAQTPPSTVQTLGGGVGGGDSSMSAPPPRAAQQRQQAPKLASIPSNKTATNDPPGINNNSSSKNNSESQMLMLQAAAAVVRANHVGVVNPSTVSAAKRDKIHQIVDAYLESSVMESKNENAAAAAAVGGENDESWNVVQGAESKENGAESIENGAAAVLLEKRQATLKEYLSTLGDQHIPAEQVRNAVYQIQCQSCRRDVDDALRRKTPLVLKGCTVPTIYDRYDNAEQHESSSLKYQLLMEEGMLGSQHKPTYEDEHCWTLEQVDHGVYWRLTRPKASTNNNNTNGTSLSTNNNNTNDAGTGADGAEGWSVEDLNLLLHDYVLLLGLPPDIVTGATNAATTPAMEHARGEALDEAMETVQTKARDLMLGLSKCARDILKSIETLQESENDDSDKNMHFKDFPMIKDTDTVLDGVMEKLLTKVTDMTKVVQRLLSRLGTVSGSATPGGGGAAAGTVASSRELQLAESRWAVAQCTRLWHAYLKGASDVLKNTTTYETRRFDLAQQERDAKLPEIFIHAPSRGFFRTMVYDKARAVHACVNAIQLILDHPTHIGGWSSVCCQTKCTTRFSHRVLLEDEVYSKMMATTEKDKHYGRLPLDLACQDVLSYVRELTMTVHGPNVQECVNQHWARRDKLLRLVSVVVANAGALVEAAADKKSDTSNEDTSALNDLLRRMEDLGRDPEPLERNGTTEDQINYLTSWRERIGPELANALEGWMTYRLYHPIPPATTLSTPPPPPVLPYIVRESMMYRDEGHRRTCHGGNGENRVACIIVGLFFRKLFDHFQERQAQLVAEELLTAVDDDGDFAPVVKPSKKKNKKKKKPALVADEKASQLAPEKDVKTPSAVVVANGKESPSHEVKPSAAAGKDVEVDVPQKLNPSTEKVVQRIAVGDGMPDGTKRQHGAATVLTKPIDQKTTVAAPVQLKSSPPSIAVGADISGNTVKQNGGPISSDAAKHGKRSTAVSRQRADAGGGAKRQTQTTQKRDPDDRSRQKSQAAAAGSNGNAHNQGKLGIDYTKVGVHDKSSFQSAEAFFVGRLTTLLSSGDVVVVV